MRVATPTLFGFELDRPPSTSALYSAALVLMVGVARIVHLYLTSPLGHAL